MSDKLYNYTIGFEKTNGEGFYEFSFHTMADNPEEAENLAHAELYNQMSEACDWFHHPECSAETLSMESVDEDGTITEYK